MTDIILSYIGVEVGIALEIVVIVALGYILLWCLDDIAMRILRHYRPQPSIVFQPEGETANAPGDQQ